MKKHRTLTVTGFSLALLFLVSCSPVRILSTTADDGFSLSDYQTYAYHEIEKETADPERFNTRIGWIKEAMDVQFASRGLERVESDADLLVNIGVVVVEEQQTRETDFRTDAPRYIGNMNYSWESEEVVVRDYERGTVVVHLIESSSQKLVWEGIATSVVEKDDQKSRKNIEAGAEKLFSGL